MDQPHLSSQLEYLEQKHQEDQQKIALLQQKVETQTYELQEQGRRVQKLEEDLAAARLALARIPQFDERLDNFKGEMMQFIEQQQSRQRPDSLTADPMIQTQFENQTKAISELRREVEKAQRQDEQILLARTEVERLNKIVSTFEAKVHQLSQKLEERTRSVSYIEEQRQADSRRVAELQVEMPKLQKQIESGLAKIQMVERQIPQFGKYEVAIEEIREELRRHREHMDFQMAQRERLLKNWTELAEEQEQRMSDHEKLMDKYVEHYQLNKRALASLQEFQERLQREQHQAQELQRLTEERQRATLEKLQADYEQRWRKQGLEWKPQVSDVRQDVQSLRKELGNIQKSGQEINKQIDMILQIIEEDIQARAASAQDWQDRFEQLANGRG